MVALLFALTIPPKQGQFQFISPDGKSKPGCGSDGGSSILLFSAWSSFVTNTTVSFPITLLIDMIRTQRTIPREQEADWSLDSLEISLRRLETLRSESVQSVI
jgi:hypothetical protein